ncbi:hypothetical protein ACFYKT_12795 [Cytobacillus sp. FJAT-53684]|uniref:Uncharacterized protein n=1 Tax=Cytobacillus mangrovibacter TaxID=3299024 RepID=A0ABW6K2L9_9BACI
MLKSLGLILIYLAISYFQIRQLIKDKMKREIWIYSIIMLVVTGITIAMIYKIPIPNPLNLIAFILKPLTKIISL